MASEKNDGLTPKQQYEERKRQRRERHAREEFERSEREIRDAEIHDIADRFVTTLERFADVAEEWLERRFP